MLDGQREGGRLDDATVINCQIGLSRSSNGWLDFCIGSFAYIFLVLVLSMRRVISTYKLSTICISIYF